MPATAIQHFTEDVGRSRAIISHAETLPPREMIRSDLLRSAWMFAVGALDAYFSDAYTDIVAATIISKSRYPVMQLPEFFQEIRFPVRAILEPYAFNLNWRWRMAARQMMERENVLSLGTIQTLFNKFFRKGHRLFGDVLDKWMVDPQAKRRMFGILPSSYLALNPNDKNSARQDALDQMQDRFAMIFQRRHDCIHNCDRPRVSPQPIAFGGTVLKVVTDVEFLVMRCDEHINSEFRHFLAGCDCPPAIVAQAGY